jgi:methionyl-tRNA formyltransferase
MPPLRVVFIGCVESSARLLREVLAVEEAQVVGVVTRRASTYNADFHSLEPMAREHGIPCLVTDESEADLATWLAERRPDIGYCFGWSHLLPEAVLQVPDRGFVGFHPAALPKNRGRHPVIWALVLGLSTTASTFFFMEAEADSGDILSQEEVEIRDHDDAGDLYARILETASAQVASFTPALHDGSYTQTPQDDAAANYWRKRSRDDGEIDWRMPARGVYNLVRALAGPYPGAHCTTDTEEVKVWKTRVVSDEYASARNLEPGKILAVHDRHVDVKCGTGVIRLLDHEFTDIPPPGDYLP